MSATISLVEAARPEGLTAAAAQLQTKIADLDSTIAAQRQALTALSGGWEGTAADAAIARGEHNIARQERFRTRLTSLQTTLADAGANMSALRTQILGLAAQARSLGGLVSDDGTVSALASGGLMTPAVAAAYTASLTSLLQIFDAVDQNSSQSIIQAVGGDSDTPTETPAPPDIETLKPPDGATDTEVNQWWDNLSHEERERLINERPDWIGNLDGVPPTARDRANRNRLETLRSDPNLTDDERRTLDEINNQLFDGDGNPLPDRQLLLVDFDGDTPRVALALGNVETADNVSVFVPGTGAVPFDNPEEGNDLPAYMDQAGWLRDQAQAVARLEDPDATVATIAWIGYEPPSNLAKALSPSYADTAAPQLASFVNGLDSSRDTDPNLTVIGHSYGSLVASEALQRGTAADNVIFTGSPGLETNPMEGGNSVTPEKLHLTEGHVFAQHADWDFVANLVPYGGAPVSDLPGFIDLSTNDEDTILGPRISSGGHSEYFNPDTTALFNQAVVVAGLAGNPEYIREED